MKAFYYIYHIVLTLLGCFLLFIVGVFFLGNYYNIFAQAGGRSEFLMGRALLDVAFAAVYLIVMTGVSLLIRHRTITRRLRVKTFLLESAVLVIDILVTLSMWATSVPDGMIGIGDDDYYFLKEISDTDSTVRYQLFDDGMILVLDADFRKPALGVTVAGDSLRRFNIEQIPNGMELRDGTILPVVTVYDGYMKDVTEK
ncbi:MAG: hypothetical protein IJV05_04405 [Muribaculaceae bacterium]|nr:hypothetical protein [Muribaculaceae bacterium]